MRCPAGLSKLDESGKFNSVRESFDIHEGVVFHSLIPHRELPSAITQLVGEDMEIIVGQGVDITWLGIGSPETLLEQMKSAIDSIGKVRPGSPGDRTASPSEISGAGSYPSWSTPDLLSSNLDAGGVKKGVRQRARRIQHCAGLNRLPIAIKLRIEAGRKVSYG